MKKEIKVESIIWEIMGYVFTFDINYLIIILFKIKLCQMLRPLKPNVNLPYFSAFHLQDLPILFFIVIITCNIILLSGVVNDRQNK